MTLNLPPDQPESITELAERLHLTLPQARRWLIEELDRISRLRDVGASLLSPTISPKYRKELVNKLNNPQRFFQKELENQDSDEISPPERHWRSHSEYRPSRTLRL